MQVNMCTVNHNYLFKMNPTSLFSTLMEEKRLELNRAHMCPLAKLMLQQVYVYLSVFDVIKCFLLFFVSHHHHKGIFTRTNWTGVGCRCPER